MSSPSQDSSPRGNKQPLTQHALLTLQVEEMRRRGEPTEEISKFLKQAPNAPNADSRPRSQSTVVRDEGADQFGTIEHLTSGAANGVSRSERARLREGYWLDWRERREETKARLKDDYGVSRIEDLRSDVRRSWLGSNSDPPSLASIYHQSQWSASESDWDHEKERGLLEEEMLAAARLQPKRCQTFDIKAVSAEPSDKTEQSPATSTTKVPNGLPPHYSVSGVVELSSYLASSSYIVSLGGPPAADLKYGIIIVPHGDEELLFTGYGDHAALPVTLEDEIRAKSAAMNAEEFRQYLEAEQAQGTSSEPDLDDDDREFYRRRWLARRGIVDGPHPADETLGQGDHGNGEPQSTEEGRFVPLEKIIHPESERQTNSTRASPSVDLQQDTASHQENPTQEASVQHDNMIPHPSPPSTAKTSLACSIKSKHAVPRSQTIKNPVFAFKGDRAEKKKRRGTLRALRAALSKIKSRRKGRSSHAKPGDPRDRSAVLVKSTGT